LRTLFQHSGKTMNPASEQSINNFQNKALDKGVPSSVIDELTTFYRISNGIPCLNGFDFHSCDDEILFEWWSKQELWLAQCDFYTLRWANDKYCIGDAADVSFSSKDEYLSLISLIENAMKEWGLDVQH